MAEPLTLLNRTAVAALAGPILARTGSWDQGMKLLKRSEKHAREMGFRNAWPTACRPKPICISSGVTLSEARHYTRKALTVSANQRPPELRNVLSLVSSPAHGGLKGGDWRQVSC